MAATPSETLGFLTLFRSLDAHVFLQEVDIDFTESERLEIVLI